MPTSPGWTDAPKGGSPLKNDLALAFGKGLVIGGTMLVPGVSGGTMAMVLGIYERLIEAVSSLRRPTRRALVFLGLCALGGVTGMLLFSRPLLLLLERFEKPTIYFFLGAVAGAVPMIFRHARVQRPKLRYGAYVLLGAALVLAMAALPDTFLPAGAGGGLGQWLLLVLAGVLAAVALVLPGISVSYFLLLLGLYDRTMRAISRLDLLFLLPLALGLALGVLACTQLLDRAMKRYPCATYLIILGFVLGSLVDTFPGLPGGGQWLACLLTAAGGFGLILLLSRYED